MYFKAASGDDNSFRVSLAGTVLRWQTIKKTKIGGDDAVIMTSKQHNSLTVSEVVLLVIQDFVALLDYNP